MQDYFEITSIIDWMSVLSCQMRTKKDDSCEQTTFLFFGIIQKCRLNAYSLPEIVHFSVQISRVGVRGNIQMMSDVLFVCVWVPRRCVKNSVTLKDSECSSGGIVGLAGDSKVASSLPGSSQLSVEVPLSKAPNPNCSRGAGCRLAWLTPQSVCESAHDLVNVIVNRFAWPLVTKKSYI